MTELLEEWGELYDIETKFGLRIAVVLILGGVLGIFIRQLYRRYSSSVSNRDSFSSLFPLLTITTILVIAVVKSSLALSLGLVGALSIVRFRAAIKDPEELIYLFFCISVGVALGADLPFIGLIGVFIFTAFVIVGDKLRGRASRHNLLLTLSGETKEFAEGGEAKVHKAIEEVAGPYQVQRLELDGGQAQFRAIIKPKTQEEIIPLMSKLQSKLPGCQISYVNLDTLL